MLFSFMRLTGNKSNCFTSIGRKTYGIYIIHGFIVKTFVAYGSYDDMNIYKIILLFIVSVFIVVLIGKMDFAICKGE